MYKIRYHVVLRTKYKENLFDNEKINYIKYICSELGKRYDLGFEAIGTDKDRIHIFVRSTPEISPLRLTQIIKSITVRELFKQFSGLKKEFVSSGFWGEEAYIETLSDEVPSDIIHNYIETQGTPEEKIGCAQVNLLKFD